MSLRKVKPILTTGSVRRHLFNLTLPTIWGMFAIVAFNLTDTFFVAKLGTNALAAMGFTFPVVLVVGSIAMGLSMGAGSVLSRAIGNGDEHLMRRTATDGIFLAVVTVVIIAAAGLLTIEPLFRLMGASEQVLPLVRDYMFIWYIGIIAVVMPPVGDGCLRATGDMMRPMIVMAVCALVNVVLDPIMIYGMFGFPRMEIRGAALATIIARICGMCANLYFVHYHAKLLDFKPESFGEVLQSWKRILHVGIPSAITQLTIPLSRGIVTALAASAGGAPAVAALAAGTRVESFFLIIPMAVGTAIIPLAGQNWGAKEFGRVDEARKYLNLTAVGYGVVSFLLVLFIGRLLSMLFSEEPEVVRLTQWYLWVIIFGHAGLHVNSFNALAINAVGMPKWAMGLNITANLFLIVPMAYLGKIVNGYMGMLVGICVSQFLAGGLSMFVGKKLLRDHRILG